MTDWDSLIAPENMHKNGGVGRKIKAALRQDDYERVNDLVAGLRDPRAPRLVVVGKLMGSNGVDKPVVLEVGDGR